MSLVHERVGAVALALRASVSMSHGAVVPQAHYHLGGIAGIRDTVGPEVWKSRLPGGPDLVRKGDPKIMSNAPEQRRDYFDSSINFAGSGQCYQAPKEGEARTFPPDRQFSMKLLVTIPANGYIWQVIEP